MKLGKCKQTKAYGKKGRQRNGGNDTGWVERGGGREERERGVYSKKPISRNAKPSSDAPQTKHPIRLNVRDIPQLNVCVPMRARCVVNSAYKTDTEKYPESLQQNVTQVSNPMSTDG